MIIVFLVFILCIIARPLKAQINTDQNTGNVGIGTSPSTNKLDVNGVINSQSYNSSSLGFYTQGILNGFNNNAGYGYLSLRSNNVDNRLVIDPNGNVGINTANPWLAFLQIVGGSTTRPNIAVSTSGLGQGEISDISFCSTFQNTGDNGPRRTADIVAGFNGNPWKNEYLAFNVGNNGSPNDFSVLTSEKMRVSSLGNVLIGKTYQTNIAYKLDVAGNVRANQIVVNSTGANFVFAPTYKLNTLATLKKYIDKNHNQPEVPSAKQMLANGLNVGDNQTKLLQKVEELTLYLIEKDDQLKKQRDEINLLKSK